METEYYPWGGEFTIGTQNGCVAVVLLTINYTPPDSVAIFGSLKTENIGIEKIIANVISNPYIRYLIICGDDIRGHNSGSSLVALHKNGIDNQHKIIDAPGAIPYIENLKNEAINRFQNQVEIVNFIGIKDKNMIDKQIQEIISKSPPRYGEPYIAIRIKADTHVNLTDKRAIHSKIVVNYRGMIKKRGK
jgi:tetrahydromethanopterin S-methyltransferase subunit A